MREGEVKELKELIHRYNLNLSFLQKQAARMYKNHVESLRETGNNNKNLQEKLSNITDGRDYFEKLQHYQDLNKDLQHRSNKDTIK